MFRSIKYKTVLIFVIPILVILMLFAYFSKKTTDLLEKNLIDNYHSFLQNRISSLDGMLDMTANRMYELMNQISGSGLNMYNEEEYEYQYIWNDIEKELSNLFEYNDFTDAIYFYDKNQQNIRILKQNRGENSRHVHILDKMDFQQFSDDYSVKIPYLGWHIYSDEDKNGLYYLCTNDRIYYLGICIDYQKMLNQLRTVDDENTVVISMLDSEHNVLIGTPPEKQEKSKVVIEEYDETLNVIFTYEINENELISVSKRFRFGRNIILMLILLVTVALFFLWISGFLRPFEKMIYTMQRISEGETELTLNYSRDKELRIIADSFNNMLEQISQYKIESYESKLEHQINKLNFLQMQIKPHFIANTLNTIYNLAYMEDVDGIKELTKYLSDYLIYNMNADKKFVSIDKEIENVNNYLSICKKQRPGRLFFEFDIDPLTENEVILPLAILTIVENSIKHGFDYQNHPLTVRITSRYLWEDDGGRIQICMEDDGRGFSEDSLKRLNSPDIFEPCEGHIGLYNIATRLRIIYNNRAYLKFSNKAEKGGLVEMTFPAGDTKIS